MAHKIDTHTPRAYSNPWAGVSQTVYAFMRHMRDSGYTVDLNNRMHAIQVTRPRETNYAYTLTIDLIESVSNPLEIARTIDKIFQTEITKHQMSNATYTNKPKYVTYGNSATSTSTSITSAITNTVASSRGVTVEDLEKFKQEIVQQVADELSRIEELIERLADRD